MSLPGDEDDEELDPDEPPSPDLSTIRLCVKLGSILPVTSAKNDSIQPNTATAFIIEL